MNNILLIDDRDDFVQAFIQEADAMSVNTSHRKSFNGLKEVLPKYQHSFAAVVLDIKCLLKDDQEKEDAGFITVALSYLDQQLPNFPRYILTGDDNEFEKFKGYFQQEKVFLKTPQDLSKLLIELKYCVDNSNILRLKRENLEVFQIFESGKMNNAAESQLIRILENGLKEKDYGKFKGILADIRSMQEGIYKSIRDRNSTVVPTNMFRSNGMIRFNDLMKHLNGNVIPPTIPNRPVYQNPTIFQLANSLYWSCGEYIHEDPNRNYFISDYTIKALINSLLEILLWSKQY
jgi:hypothetical protein